MWSSYLYDDPKNKEASFVPLKPGLLGHGWSMVLIPARERLRQKASWGYIINASESYIWLRERHRRKAGFKSQK